MTIPALPITMTARGNQVTVGLGTRPERRIVGTLTPNTSITMSMTGPMASVCGEIVVTVPDRAPQRVSPYRLPLQRWTRDGTPSVRTHPLAILHLLATGQCDVDELLQGIAGLPASQPAVSMAIRRPCELLDMLKVPVAALSLATRMSGVLVRRAGN